jgi:2-iminobutanoate/2-iminopropanoate deaminase
MKFSKHVIPAVGCIFFLFISCMHVIPEKEVIFTDSAPRPFGKSSQAVKSGEVLYVAGQIGIEPRFDQLVPGGILAETQQALQNIDNLLRSSGYTSRNLIRMEIYLTNINDYMNVQLVLDNYFRDLPPVVHYVEVNRLPRGAMISIMATASM